MYSPGDKIFAKVKGHPHWPSRINLLPPDVHIPKGKYPIFFYGTHEVYFLAPKDIYPYEKFKHKFAVRRNKPLFQVGLQEIEDDPDVLLYKKDPNAELFLARFYKFGSSVSGTNNLEARAAPPTPPVASASAVSTPNNSDKKQGTSIKRPIKLNSEASQSPAKRARPERRQRTSATKLTVTPTPTSNVKSASGRRQSGRNSQPPSVSLRSATPASSSAPFNGPLPVASPTVPRVSILRLRLPLDEKGDRLRVTALGASPATGTGNTTGLSSPSPFSSSTSPSSNVTVEARENTQPVSQPQRTNRQHLPHRPATATTTTEPASLPSDQPGGASTTTVTASPATDPLRITIRQVPVAVPKADSNDAGGAQSSTALVVNSDSAGAGLALRPFLFSVTSSTLAGNGGADYVSASGTDEDNRLLSARKRSTAVVTPMRQESDRPPRAEATQTKELGDIKGNSTGHSLVKASKQVDSGAPLSGSKRLSSSDSRKCIADHIRSTSSKKSKHKRRSLLLIDSDEGDDDDYAKHKSKRLPSLMNAQQKPPRRMPNTSPFSTQSSPVDDVGESDEFQRPNSVSSSSVGTVSKVDSNTAKSLESPVQSSITTKPSSEICPASPTEQPLFSCAAGEQAGSTVRQQQQERQLKELDAEARLLLIDRAIKSSLVRGNEDVATCVDRLEMLDRMVLTLPVIAKCWTVVETIRKCRRYKRSIEVKIAAQRVFNKFLQVYACADKFEMELAHTELLRLQERFVSASASAPNHGNAQMDGVSQQALASYSVPKSMADLFQVSASTLAERRRQSTGTNATKGMTSAKTDEPAMTSYNTNDNTLTLEDIPLPEESVITNTASVDQAVRKTSTDESVATLVTSPLPLGCPSGRGIQHDMGEEFEVLDEYDEENQQLASALQLQDDYSTEQGCELEEPAEPDKPTVVDEEETEEGEIRDCGGISPPPQQSRTDLVRPSPSRYPAFSHHHHQQRAALPDDGPADSSVSYLSQASHSGHHYHHYQKAVSSEPSTSIEMTTPQVASRAYIPHSLHPSNDPPPPYRPYNPNYVDRVKPVVFPRGDDVRGRREKRRHSSLGSPPISASSKENADHDQKRVVFRSPLPLDPPPPHRARSPHALPHPLEHYQRCLTTALVSDEGEPVVLDRPHGRSNQRHVSRQYSSEDSVSRPQCAPPDAADAFENQLPPEDAGNQSSSSGCMEDLDTRIARMLNSSNNSQSSSPKKVQDLVVQSGGLTVGSPPPPPPPLPPSHRVIFTHRPPLPLPPHNFQKHRQQMAGPPPPAVPSYQHRAPPPTGNRMPPAYRRHPPHPPSSLRSMQHRGPSNYLRDNRMHFIGGGARECLPPHHPHHPRGQREGDAPQSGYGRDFHSPPPGAAYPSNRNRRGSGQEKDREIYSMLGV